MPDSIEQLIQEHPNHNFLNTIIRRILFIRILPNLLDMRNKTLRFGAAIYCSSSPTSIFCQTIQQDAQNPNPKKTTSSTTIQNSNIQC